MRIFLLASLVSLSLCSQAFAAKGVPVGGVDDGPGVDTAEIEKLFEVFYRSADAPRRASGSGIGLFVCRELVHAMGGRTWGRNGDDKGAEFGFSLPAFVPDDDRAMEGRLGDS